MTTTVPTTAALQTARITVLGYGSQGRAHALNLKDSGLDVTVGVRRGGPSWEKARARRPQGRRARGGGEGRRSRRGADARHGAAGAVRRGHRNRTSSRTRRCCSRTASTCTSSRSRRAADIDVILVAPKGPGALVRREYEKGHGVPCIYAIEQDASGSARDKVLAYAAGIGGARAMLIETSFAEETETDLFGEQAVLCGGATELVLAGFETLTEAGYQPEIAYYEVLHELKLIVDLLHEGGLAKMHQFISETAQYGDLTRGPRVVDADTKARMKQILTEIQQGQFAREWTAEYKAGNGNYRALKQRDLAHPIEQVGASLRARMPWLKPGAADLDHGGTAWRRMPL